MLCSNCQKWRKRFDYLRDNREIILIKLILLFLVFCIGGAVGSAENFLSTALNMQTILLIFFFFLVPLFLFPVSLACAVWIYKKYTNYILEVAQKTYDYL